MDGGRMEHFLRGLEMGNRAVALLEEEVYVVGLSGKRRALIPRNRNRVYYADAGY